MRRWWILVAVLLALHGALALLRPLHLDSLFTGGKMLLSWGDLWHDLKVNAYTPLYYLLLKAFTSVAGTSVFALHLPGLLAAVASAVALAWAMRPVCASADTRFLAAALAGLHPFLLLQGSGYAKVYAPLWLVMILGAGFLLRGRMRPYLFCCVVASQLHLPGLALPAIGLLRRESRRASAAALLLSLCLLLPWLERGRSRIVEGVGMEWIPALSAKGLARRTGSDLLFLFTGTHRPRLTQRGVPEEWLAVLLLLVLLGLAILGALLVRHRGEGRRFGRIALALPLGALLIACSYRPLYSLRYAGVALFPACALLAAAYGDLRDRGRRRLALSLLLIAFAGRAAGFLELGLHPISRDWRALYAEAPRVARSEGATLVVMDGFRWTAVWTSYCDHLDGRPPDPPSIAWAKGFGTPAPPPELASHERVLVAGYEAPFLPGFLLERRFGDWGRYDEWLDAVVHRPRYALFRRKAPTQPGNAD